MSHPVGTFPTMGYRGKLAERDRARELRAKAWTLQEIADELGVAKSTVSVWVRDVDFVPQPRNRGGMASAPHPMRLAKLAQIEHCDAQGIQRLGTLSDQAFLAAGAALYAGDGSKRDGTVQFSNSNPAIISFFMDWLRCFFEPDEKRIRIRLYLHEGLDLSAATAFWSDLVGVPESQFIRPYRANPDAGIRHTKHWTGCCHVRYSCAKTHRQIMGLIRALLSSDCLPG